MAMRNYITLQNTHHGTKTVVCVRVDPCGDFELDQKQVERVRQKLCPGVFRRNNHPLNAHGPQIWRGREYVFTEYNDGTVKAKGRKPPVFS